MAAEIFFAELGIVQPSDMVGALGTLKSRAKAEEEDSKRFNNIPCTVENSLHRICDRFFHICTSDVNDPCSSPQCHFDVWWIAE
jgi:hypothetical protein